MKKRKKREGVKKREKREEEIGRLGKVILRAGRTEKGKIRVV